MAKLGKAQRLISLAMGAILAAVRAARASRRSRDGAAANLSGRPNLAVAASQVDRPDTEARPVGEETVAHTSDADTEVHLPAPSIWPAAVAFGVTLLFFGVVTSAGFIVAGAALTAIAIAGWIGELRHV